MLRVTLGVAAIALVSAGTAHAQLPMLPAPPGYEQPTKSENALQEAESERQHRAALKLIPNRKVSKDPWHNLRAAPQNATLDRHRVE